MSAISRVTSGLGYPGSHTVKRTHRGIESTDISISAFTPLMNYPMLITLTRAAMDKLKNDSEEKPHQELRVYAVSTEEQKANIFTLHNAFFNQIRASTSQESEITFKAPDYTYLKNSRTFDRPLTCFRGFPGWQMPYARIVQRFQATFIPSFLRTNEQYQAKDKLLFEFPERLHLRMDVTAQGEWNLELLQKG